MTLQPVTHEVILSELIKLNLSALGSKQRAVVTHYLATLDATSTAAHMSVEVETVTRALRKVGIGRVLRKALEGGALFKIVDDQPTSTEPPAPQVEKPEPVRLDVVERHRYEQAANASKAEIKKLTERLAAAEDHRASILGLSFEPVEPICAPRIDTGASRGRQAAVLHLSDLHVGEVVNLEEMMGVNHYNLDIARKRIARAFETTTILTTTAWPKSDGAPSRIFILLGGDLVSGHGLHPELAETDAGTWYEQTKWAANFIASGALMLSLELKEHYGHEVEIVFISVIGNHGRSTPGKPRAKLAAIQSYDTLVADFVEASLKSYPSFKFYAPRAFDAYFDIVGWPTLLTHGDRMSAGGGTGFIGPAANIVKGHKKLILTEAQQRRPVRFIFSGHFHTTLTTPWGFGNGAGIGPSEFAKAIRADLEPAQQNYAVLHERLGLLRWHPIVLGRADEGTIYSPTSGSILPSLLTN